MAGKTLYDKLWQRHLITQTPDGQALIYIDRHLIHEVTSPQAFEGLRLANRRPWRRDLNLAVPDHNVPTDGSRANIQDKTAKAQVDALDNNCKEYQLLEYDITHPRQGIVHIVGPENGVTLPGMTIVCGDSHTSTHGAFGALAFGIGTSEVEHVLATQCLRTQKMKNMLVSVTGSIPDWASAKDVILAVIGQIGTAGGTGYTIEFAGSVIDSLSMEGRMTLCNMAIEAGARSGLVAVDQKTIDYVYGRPFAPKGQDWERAVSYWQSLISDDDAVFDKTVTIDLNNIKPQVTWGTSPEMVASIDDSIPDPAVISNHTKKVTTERALDYMGLAPGQLISEIKLDRVFIGSCTNARIEDLRAAAKVVKGYKVSGSIKQAMVVPGSGLVKQQAEDEGLDLIFKEAGFEWREPGCSMCLAMNADRLLPGEHCASTSNRNFEGRQGFGGRTHLVSPTMAAAAAIQGKFADIRSWSYQ